VDALMRSETNEWDVELVRTIFEEDAAVQIL
jgi:hypothetical protein